MCLRNKILKQCRKADPGGTFLYRFEKEIYTFGEMQFPVPPESLLDHGHILKNSSSVITGFDPDHRFFIKKYKKNGWYRTLKRMLQPARAYSCLAAALRLREIGIPTPQVLLASRYCLITEILPPDHIFLQDDPETARHLIPFIAKLHKYGIRHGDLNLRNIYLTPAGTFGLIDMDSVRLYSREVPEKERFLELARVISSYIKQGNYTPDRMEQIAHAFAELYKKETGFEFQFNALMQRIIYLVSRKKKKK